MSRPSSARALTISALIAALYAVLGYFGSVFSLTFGPVQVRFAEALTVLPFLFPAAAPGLAVGCFLTNLASPYGAPDLILGTLATALSAWLTSRTPRWYLAALPPVLVNLLLLPPLWAWLQTGGFSGAFLTAWAANAALFAPGEIAACWGLGTLLLRALPRIAPLRAHIPPRRLAQLGLDSQGII